jgi:hypothetical protein
MHSVYRHNNGASLVECLLALLLSSFVSLLVASVLTAQYYSYQYNIALAQSQQNARIVGQRLKSVIRNFAYQGCDSSPHRHVVNLTAKAAIQPELQLFRADSGTMPAQFDANLINALQQNSVVLMLTLFHPLDEYLVEDMTSLRNMRIHLTRSLADGDVLLLADCEVSHQFQVANSHYLGVGEIYGVESNVDLSKFYARFSQILRPTYLFFYIADSGRKRLNGEPVYALFEKYSGQAAQEIAEGISALQVRFLTENLIEDRHRVAYVEIKYQTHSMQMLSAAVPGNSLPLLVRDWLYMIALPNKMVLS